MSAFFQSISQFASELNWPDFFATSATSYLLILAAEIGDKSQLVCMVLAARYRATPVFFGSVSAFLLLNTLAVIFGLAIIQWLPQVYIYSVVAILFATFGIHALRMQQNDDDEMVTIMSNRHLLFSTFLLISVAEFGDKTQLAVVALSTSAIPVGVWLGSTLALVTTSALGVWAGRTLLQKIPMKILHRISGVLFLLLAIFAGYSALF